MRFWIVISLFLLAGCTSSPGPAPQDQTAHYFFDLKGFIGKEAQRMNAEGSPLLKTVLRENSVEKKLSEVDWAEELQLFMESDINKAAWKNSYKKVVRGDTTFFIATDENLRTTAIRLERDGTGKLNRIGITNKTSNFLYSSVETLSYFPDSAYVIEKTQSVRLLGDNNFKIIGELK